MNENQTNQDSGGTDVLLVLQIVLAVLKFFDVISWSWWAVLIPTWISLFILLIAVIVLSSTRK